MIEKRTQRKKMQAEIAHGKNILHCVRVVYLFVSSKRMAGVL